MTRSFFLVAAAFVVASLVLAGSPSLLNGFLNYDDPAVILDNPRLDDPSLGDVFGAFTELRADAWLPLYVVALMPDARQGDGQNRRCDIKLCQIIVPKPPGVRGDINRQRMVRHDVMIFAFRHPLEQMGIVAD